MISRLPPLQRLCQDNRITGADDGRNVMPPAGAHITLLLLREPGDCAAAGKGHRIRPVQFFAGRLGVCRYARDSDRPQPMMTASAGLSYLWQGTRFSIDLLAGSGTRTTRPGGPPNGGSLPSYEQVNLGISHSFELPHVGAIKVRF